MALLRGQVIVDKYTIFYLCNSWIFPNQSLKLGQMAGYIRWYWGTRKQVRDKFEFFLFFFGSTTCMVGHLGD